MASESNVPKLKKSFERHVRPPPCERARSAHPRTGTVPTKPGQRPVSQRGSSGHIGTNTVCKEATPPLGACGRRLQSSPAKESLPPSPWGRGCGVPGTALRGTGRRGRRGAQPAAVAHGGSSPQPGPQSPRQEDDSGAKRVVQRGAAPPRPSGQTQTPGSQSPAAQGQTTQLCRIFLLICESGDTTTARPT